MTKRAVIQLRVSEEEKAAFVAAAGEAGFGVSEWLRRLAVRGTKSQVPLLSVADYRASMKAGKGVGQFAVDEDAVGRVQAGNLPSAAQVAKRPFKSDFK